MGDERGVGRGGPDGAPGPLPGHPCVDATTRIVQNAASRQVRESLRRRCVPVSADARPSHSPGEFAALPPPETEDVARVLAGTARRIPRLLERSRVDEEDDPIAGDDPLMAMLGAASIRSRIATGPEAGEPWRRLGDRVEAVEEDEAGVEPRAAVPPRCVRQGGMSLHADVVVPARDRQRLERLCRYVARPPLALVRLEATPDGRLAYRLKTPWRDGIGRGQARTAPRLRTSRRVPSPSVCGTPSEDARRRTCARGRRRALVPAA